MTDDDPHADLKQHRWTPEIQALFERRPAFAPKKIHKRRQHFVIVPATWVERLTKARYIATYRVALHVLYQHWKHRGEPFLLANGVLMIEGVSRGTKWRALEELEQFGLISIERRPRKSPRISVIV